MSALLGFLLLSPLSQVTPMPTEYASELKKLGAKVTYNDEGTPIGVFLSAFGRFSRADVTNVFKLDRLETLIVEYPIFGDRECAGLIQLSSLRRLDLSGNRFVTHRGMVHIGKFRTLQVLTLDNTRLDDRGLKALCGIATLKQLGVRNTRITSAGLVHIKNLRRLQVLALAKTRVDSRGVAHMSGHPTIEALHLYDTLVDDSGLKHLASLKNLKQVHLDNTRVTAVGVKSLRDALPDCTVFWNDNKKESAESGKGDTKGKAEEKTGTIP